MTRIFINGAAVITPIGLNTIQTCSSARTGIMRFEELNWKNRDFAPVVMASIPDDCLPVVEVETSKELPFGLRGKRMLQLMAGLQKQILQIIPEHNIPFLIGVDQCPDMEPDLSEYYLKLMAEAAGVKPDPFFSRLICQGRASGLKAIIEGIKLLETGKASAVLAGGCDTFKDLFYLSVLNAQARLKSEINRDGFIPGEAAGVVLLSIKPLPDKSLGQCCITAGATGFEPGHIYSPESYLGKGLSQTFTALFDQYDTDKQIKTVYASMNGENFWAKEWSVAGIRNSERFAQDVDLEHPADCYGDPGAAAGAVMTALAMDGITRQYKKNPILIYASSDFGERTAIIIDRQSKKEK